MSEVSRKAERKSRAEWEELMSAYEGGDFPQREFCKVNGVAFSTFGYWRKRLRTAAADTTWTFRRWCKERMKHPGGWRLS